MEASSPADVAARLGDTGYLCDDDLATVTFLGLRMQRPFLLEVLSTYQVSIPELGTIRASTPPVVVLTSNRTRELHDALKRRCLYHWIDHPGLDREVEIVRSRAPEVSATLARQVVGVVQQLRARDDLEKPPGVAETLDWARALQHLGTTELDLESSARTLGALVKYREDADRVRVALDHLLTP